MLTKEQLEKNVNTYFTKLKEYNAYSDDLFKYLGDQIKYSPATNINNLHGCFEGGLIAYILTITRYIVKLNEIIPENQKCDKNYLIKIALLSNIGRTFMYKKTEEEWKIKKGYTYDYVELNLMSIYERSIVYCYKNGINLSESEAADILSLGKDEEKQVVYFNSKEGKLLKLASELAIEEMKKQVK